MIGSNDTFTLWLNGKQVYDSQISRSWAPDHARIDVPLERGTNRILVKCGNTGGNWLYSVAVSVDPAHVNEGHAKAIAHEGRDFEHLRDALPALQVAARSALDRFQHKLDGKTPAEEMAAILSAEEREIKSAEERAPREDAGRRAELAAGQRRIASALANLDAPDAPREGRGRRPGRRSRPRPRGACQGIPARYSPRRPSACRRRRGRAGPAFE